MWKISWPQPSRCEIPIANTLFTASERSNVIEAIDSGWISSNGKWNEQAENALSKLIGVESLLVSNGTVALTLALRALGIKSGDEVIVPSLTFAATASAVATIGAIPIFCDVNKLNWNTDEENLHSLISKKTKAIIAVHLYGFPAPMKEIVALARKFNIFVIEDCAEAPLATIGGLNVGSYGDASTYSFFANKLISCGEGGAVASKNPDILSRMRLLRGQGMDTSRRYYFVEPGFNFRLSNIQAAILSAQLEKALDIKKSWNQQHEQYRIQLLKQGVDFTEQKLEKDQESSPWLYTILLNQISIEKKLDLAIYLANKGVETRPVFFPLHQMPAFLSSSKSIVNAIEISREGISLPTGSHMNESTIEFVVQEICNFFETN